MVWIVMTTRSRWIKRGPTLRSLKTIHTIIPFHSHLWSRYAFTKRQRKKPVNIENQIILFSSSLLHLLHRGPRAYGRVTRMIGEDINEERDGRVNGPLLG